MSEPSTPERQKGLALYMRLVGYCFEYRFRIAILFVLSVVVAGAFTSTIFSVGTFVQLMYDSEESAQANIARLGASFEGAAERVAWATSRSPAELREAFEARLHGVRDDRSSALRTLAAVLIALTLLGGLCRYFQEYYAASIGVRVATRLHQQMFDNLLLLSHGFYERRQTGDIIARFLNDAFAVNTGLVAVLVQLFREPIKIALCMMLAFSVDPWLTMMVLFVLSPIVILVVSVGRYVRTHVRTSFYRMGLLTSSVGEMIHSIGVIKAFGMEDFESRRFAQVLHRVRKAILRLVRANAAIAPASEVVLILGICFFMIVSEERVLSGDLSGGDMVLLFGALAAMLQPLRKLAKSNNQIQTSIAAATRVFEFVDALPEIAEKSDAIEIPPMADALRFDEVQFAYSPDQEVLQKITFGIQKGEMVALVGLSGAGKTTVAKLIPRFYDVIEGSITIDGTDVRDATIKSLREQIGIVTQETVLFNDTIRHNIAFGRDEYTDSDVREAARKAHIAEFIEGLPGGYDFELSENGTNLSGGQRQRLAIARAILKDPAILILDEATSSLDSESEQAIREAISEFVTGRATLVIAHRLSTVKRADRILVMDKGRIVEQGTHETLLAQGGLYKRLYGLQFADAEPEDGRTSQAR